MNIFKKDKDLILKITNGVLVLWLIGSIVALYVNTIDILMPSKVMTYPEYREINCAYDTTITDKLCNSNYVTYNSYDEVNKPEKIKIILTSVGSIIIVSATLYLLNNVKKEKKK